MGAKETEDTKGSDEPSEPNGAVSLCNTKELIEGPGTSEKAD
jgi:hypothetical protein